VCLWIWENEAKLYHPLNFEIYKNGPDQYSSSILYFETYVFHLEILLHEVFYLGALSPPIPLIMNTLATQQEEKDWVGMVSGAPEASLFPQQKRSFYINLPVHNARPYPQSIPFGPWMKVTDCRFLNKAKLCFVLERNDRFCMVKDTWHEDTVWKSFYSAWCIPTCSAYKYVEKSIVFHSLFLILIFLLMIF
jgi:hypothetical protein